MKIGSVFLGKYAKSLLIAPLLHFVFLPSHLPDVSAQEPSSFQEEIPEVHLNEKGISESAECGKCHKDIYKTWKNSLHSQSITNPVFWTSYLKAYYDDEEAAMELCVSCHAPVARFNNDYKLLKDVTREGINCSFCHSISETFMDKNRRRYKHSFGLLFQGPLKNTKSPVHRTKFNQLYQQSIYCAGCHEYESGNGIKILGTFSEWKASPYPAKGINCQDCHMRKVAGRIVKEPLSKTAAGKISSHNIAGGHSVAMRKRSVRLEITSVRRFKKRITVTVNVTNHGAGHKIPTGLPSKKMTLKVAVVSEKGVVYDEGERIYQKILKDKNGKILVYDSDIMLGKGEKIATDTRIGPKETRKEEFIFFADENVPLQVKATVYYSHLPEIIQVSPIRIKIREVAKPLGK